MLNHLPSPPAGKSGWPWTQESDPLSPFQPNGNPWPRISIITPSYNQGPFIEETIRSILLQNYPNIEYIIIDGGSKDNTVDIINKYLPWITFWESKADRGQSHAINKGFERSTGDLVNWICSDDLLCMNALNQFVSHYYVGNTFCYIGKCLLIDKMGIMIGATSSRLITISELTDIKNHWRKDDSIAQQSTLYPLAVVKKINGLRESNHFTMDYELWGELLINGVHIINVPLEIGIYRWYEGQKTSYVLKSTKSLVVTALYLISRTRGLNSIEKTQRKISVIIYYITFIYHHFRSFLGIRRRVSKVIKNGV